VQDLPGHWPVGTPKRGLSRGGVGVWGIVSAWGARLLTSRRRASHASHSPNTIPCTCLFTCL
jgi:hypothetical protein